jgi:hypothetical protein
MRPDWPLVTTSKVVKVEAILESREEREREREREREKDQSEMGNSPFSQLELEPHQGDRMSL